ncbi:MAG: response regulator transcription factor [Actinomycetota bacterium]|jgi:DNA-binding response OmpR family regulator|nr:response regulator transcription factor [Actinomycetota bacterium]
MAHSVLIVEDEVKLRNLIRTNLEREGLNVLTTGSGAEAIELVSRYTPELVILDLGLPDVSGLEVAKEIRFISDVLILMLTARSSDEDRIRGLELGADDYVIKPFSPRELVLRVIALLRRGSVVAARANYFSFGDGLVTIDEERHEVRLNEVAINLSPTEWGILLELARVPGRVYSRYELVNVVRGYEWEGYERVIDSHIKNLRRKLDDDSTNPKLIETVLGVGYRLCLTRDDLK